MTAHVSSNHSRLSADPSACHIRGRMISCREFLPRLKNYCLSLGFHQPEIVSPDPAAELDTIYAEPFHHPLGTDRAPVRADHDSVIVLSAKIPYDPSWGVYTGLPRPLIHETGAKGSRTTVADYIAPYLELYRFARDHIFLADTAELGRLVTLPADLADSAEGDARLRLRLRLDRLVSTDAGAAKPDGVADSFVSYPPAPSFLDHLERQGFSWEPGRIKRIGRLLTAELFGFDHPVPETDDDRLGFARTLLPQIKRIVTSTNPQLAAAMLHLQQEFAREVERLEHGDDAPSRSANLLCVAGLDIDLEAFTGRGKHYFVPWAAYCRQGSAEQCRASRLAQDELFVALMSQERRCST